MHEITVLFCKVEILFLLLLLHLFISFYGIDQSFSVWSEGRQRREKKERFMKFRHRWAIQANQLSQLLLKYPTYQTHVHGF